MNIMECSDNDDSVFNRTVIELDKLNKIIPKNNYLQPQINLRETMTEWCVTTYMINQKKYITICMKKPDMTKRIYFNIMGDRILYELKPLYEQFVVSNIYWYVQS